MRGQKLIDLCKKKSQSVISKPTTTTEIPKRTDIKILSDITIKTGGLTGARCAQKNNKDESGKI